jgi:peptidyl-prolyl cis-trans isomerase SurA
MRGGCQLALLFVIVVFLGRVLSRAQEVVDRMVAVVNKRVILESEMDQARRVELLLQGKPPTSEKPSPQDIQALLDRLIDRLLLEQQITDPAIVDPTPAELAERIKEIRGQIPGAASDDGWKKVLAAYGLEQVDIENHLVSEFRVLRFLDLRFRKLVHVDKAEIAAYYQESLLPELRRQGAPAPPLEEVSGKIEDILVEQRMDEMLNEWLQTLRAQAHIEKLAPFAASGTNGVQA